MPIFHTWPRQILDFAQASDWFGHTAQHWWPWSGLAQQLEKKHSAGSYRLFLTDTALESTGKWCLTGLGCAEQVSITLPGHPSWSHSPSVSSCPGPVPPGPVIFSGLGSHRALQTSAFLLWLNSDLSSKAGILLVLKRKGVCLIICFYYWIIIQRAN